MHSCGEWSDDKIVRAKTDGIGQQVLGIVQEYVSNA